jgi:DHA2 family multidrug resistance protein
MVSRGTVLYRSRLGERLVPGDTRVDAWLQSARAVAMKLGDPAGAARRALAMLDGYVTRQASVLAYNHVYQLITMAFLACLPLVLMLRRPRGHVEVEIGAE